MDIVEINTSYIKLDQFLKYSGIAFSGGEAKMMILDGIIYVNDTKTVERGKKLYPEDIINIKADDGDISFQIKKAE